ncbi:MAG: hypothetical protein LBD49_04795 [Oscillospiraceae bacterium]|nr:hypothetical protein [Oscillospiraceae bacterium]
MKEIVSIKLNDKGKIYFFDPRGLAIGSGARVVVETGNGIAYGVCSYGNHEVEESIIVPPLRPVIRLATPEDDERAAACIERNADDLRLCQEKIDEMNLPMKLISSERSFDGSRITFHFTSESRVDFRKLVWELSQMFRTRVMLIQVAARDKAKLIGGLGVCGRPFCCSRFLRDFHPVSIKMAKMQGLSLNPVKIAGTCGKLMCCLKYEQKAYEDLLTRAPKINAFVETPYGKGSIVGINLLRGVAKVRLEDGGDATLKSVAFDELDVLGGKTRRAEYQTAKAEGRLEEAGFKPSVIRKPEPIIIPDFLADAPPAPPAKGTGKRGADGRGTGGRGAGAPAPRPTAPRPAAPDMPARGGAGERPPAPRPEPVKKPGPGRKGGYNKNKRRGVGSGGNSSVGGNGDSGGGGVKEP